MLGVPRARLVRDHYVVVVQGQLLFVDPSPTFATGFRNGNVVGVEGFFEFALAAGQLM